MGTGMTSVEVVPRINPELVGSSDRVESECAGRARVPARRLTRLDADYYAATERVPTVGVPARRPAERIASEPRPASRDSACLRFLERVVGGWAPTLRGSVLLVTAFLGAAVLLVLALGLTGVMLSTGLATLACWANAAGRLPRA
jgi:hypothetical protein